MPSIANDAANLFFAEDEVDVDDEDFFFELELLHNTPAEVFIDVS